MLKSHIHFNGRKIGPGEPMYIIAEMSANHHQNYDEALRLLKAAKECGADAVKLQTYTPDTLTIKSDEPSFRISGGTLWDGQTLYDLYGKAFMPWQWQPRLKKEADAIGLDLFSTPYDVTSLEFLEKMNMPIFKIASFEVIDIPLIEKIASKNKPIIMSTGMANLEEIEEAVAAAKSAGATEIALLKCTSAYPSAAEEMNLKSIPFLREKFQIPVGLSDHTLGGAVAIASVGLGSCILEKHFTFSRLEEGPDSSFSLEPSEFRAMVDGIRMAEKAMGKIFFGVNERESKSHVFRRSLFAVMDILKGEILTEEKIRSIRPGMGLKPKYFRQLLGKKAASDIKRGTPLNWDLIEK